MNEPSISLEKPFLRWAGGKSWLIKYLDDILLRRDFNRYHEPFLGGGAVFLATDCKEAYLSDLNQELINTYLAIKENPYAVIDILKSYENKKEFYYAIRKEKHKDLHKIAARFIFLNQTSYNGLYRVNIKGEYNVPYGFRAKNFLEEHKLLEISKKLQTTTLECCDFMGTIDNISKGDLVFLDPPYTVSHNHNGFIKYNKKLFSIEDQIRLSNYIDLIKDIGAYYVLTNAAHENILSIFNKGDRWIELERASLIGGENARRGPVSEYLFTNVM